MAALIFFSPGVGGKVYHVGVQHFLFCDCGTRLGIGISPAALRVFCKANNSERIAEVTFSGQGGMDPTLPSGKPTSQSEGF